MLSFRSRDDEPVRYLTHAAKKQYTNRDESAFIEAVIAVTEFIFNIESAGKVAFLLGRRVESPIVFSFV